MTIPTVERAESHLYPAGEKVPFYDWLDAFMKLAQRLERENPLKFSVKGTKYDHVDYWRALAYKCLTQQATKAALDELDKLLAGRTPGGGAGKKLLRGAYPRHERLVPHASQVNEFIKKLPKTASLPDSIGNHNTLTFLFLYRNQLTTLAVLRRSY